MRASPTLEWTKGEDFTVRPVVAAWKRVPGGAVRLAPALRVAESPAPRFGLFVAAPFAPALFFPEGVLPAALFFAAALRAEVFPPPVFLPALFLVARFPAVVFPAIRPAASSSDLWVHYNAKTEGAPMRSNGG